jgi:predicted 2-oxoglutarate/Fe(II)-dependent dioxygenase YbiX
MKLITSEEISLVENLFHDLNEFRKRDRSYEVKIIESEVIFPIKIKLLNWVSEHLNLKFHSSNQKFQILRYDTNDFFLRHNDDDIKYRHAFGKNRYLVTGFHLNDDYTGGEYIVYNPKYIITKEIGVPYVFEANRDHEVKIVTSGTRRSVVMFITHEDVVHKTNNKII